MSAKCQKRTLAQTQQPDRQWEMSTAQKLLASLGWMRRESAWDLIFVKPTNGQLFGRRRQS